MEGAYTGFGVLLTDMKVFGDGLAPLFQTPWGADTSHIIGEDIMFCHAARQQGYQLFIDHDLSRQVKHVGQYSFSWQDQVKA